MERDATEKQWTGERVKLTYCSFAESHSLLKQELDWMPRELNFQSSHKWLLVGRIGSHPLPATQSTEARANQRGNLKSLLEMNHVF